MQTETDPDIAKLYAPDQNLDYVSLGSHRGSPTPRSDDEDEGDAPMVESEKVINLIRSSVKSLKKAGGFNYNRR